MKRKRRRALLPLVRSQLHLLRGEGSKLLITASEKTSLWYVFCWKVPINEAAMMLFPFDLPSIPSLSFLPSREQWGPGSWRLPQASRRLGRGQPSEGSRAGCEIWRGEIRQRQRKEAHSQEPRENLQLLWRRWDRLKALVFCAALLFSGFISKMKEVGNDFLRILLQEASRHIFWLYSSLCLLSPFCLSLFPFNPWKVLLRSTMGPCRMFAGVQQRPLYSSCPTRPSLLWASRRPSLAAHLRNVPRQQHLLSHIKSQQQFSAGDYRFWAGERCLHVQSPGKANNPLRIQVLNILHPYSFLQAKLVLRKIGQSLLFVQENCKLQRDRIIHRGCGVKLDSGKDSKFIVTVPLQSGLCETEQKYHKQLKTRLPLLPQYISPTPTDNFPFFPYTHQCPVLAPF